MSHANPIFAALVSAGNLVLPGTASSSNSNSSEISNQEKPRWHSWLQKIHELNEFGLYRTISNGCKRRNGQATAETFGSSSPKILKQKIPKNLSTFTNTFSVPSLVLCEESQYTDLQYSTDPTTNVTNFNLNENTGTGGPGAAAGNGNFKRNRSDSPQLDPNSNFSSQVRKVRSTSSKPNPENISREGIQQIVQDLKSSSINSSGSSEEDGGERGSLAVKPRNSWQSGPGIGGVLKNINGQNNASSDSLVSMGSASTRSSTKEGSLGSKDTKDVTPPPATVVPSPPANSIQSERIFSKPTQPDTTTQTHQHNIKYNSSPPHYTNRYDHSDDISSTRQVYHSNNTINYQTIEPLDSAFKLEEFNNSGVAIENKATEDYIKKMKEEREEAMEDLEQEIFGGTDLRQKSYEIPRLNVGERIGGNHSDRKGNNYTGNFNGGSGGHFSTPRLGFPMKLGMPIVTNGNNPVDTNVAKLKSQGESQGMQRPSGTNANAPGSGGIVNYLNNKAANSANKSINDPNGLLPRAASRIITFDPNSVVEEEMVPNSSIANSTSSNFNATNSDNNVTVNSTNSSNSNLNSSDSNFNSTNSNSSYNRVDSENQMNQTSSSSGMNQTSSSSGVNQTSSGVFSQNSSSTEKLTSDVGTLPSSLLNPQQLQPPLPTYISIENKTSATSSTDSQYTTPNQFQSSGSTSSNSSSSTGVSINSGSEKVLGSGSSEKDFKDDGTKNFNLNDSDEGNSRFPPQIEDGSQPPEYSENGDTESSSMKNTIGISTSNESEEETLKRHARHLLKNKKLLPSPEMYYGGIEGLKLNLSNVNEVVLPGPVGGVGGVSTSPSSSAKRSGGSDSLTPHGFLRPLNLPDESIILKNSKKFDNEYEADITASSQFLGEGASGKVMKCLHRSSGTMRAAKFIPKGVNKVTRAQNTEFFVNELACLRKLDHPHVVKLHE